MAINYEPTIQTQTVASIFTKHIAKVIPLAFDESMSYYECICAFRDYLNTVIIPNVNNVNDAVAELQQIFLDLQADVNTEIENFENGITNDFNNLHDYVENYFANLDVQEEINNKLDDMAESGVLEEIITSYLNSQALFCYNNVNEMKQATNLINGSYARTLGYYNAGDLGNAIYKISDTSTNDIRTINLNNGLYAITQIDDIIIGNTLGLHNDKTTDDSTILQNIINYCKTNDKELLIKGIVYTTTTIDTKGIKIKGIGTPSNAPISYISSTYGDIGFDYLKNVNNGALITFNDYINDNIKTGSAIISDIANPILQCKNEEGKFNLENITICGWLRNNNNQIGVKTVYETDDDEYINGHHIFKNVNVINCSGTGIHLESLENTVVENLQSNFNFGYGLHIEGVDNYDTPFEYVDLNNCKFNGNKLGGFYAHNCFRKQVRFNRCQSNYAGLYNPLELEIPSNTDDLVFGFKIDGKESSSTATREILEFNNCYGEETNKLIEILANTSGSQYILNKVNIHNCICYPYGVQNANCLLNFKTYYTDYFSFYNNLFNGVNYMHLNVVNHLTPLEVDQYFYNTFTNVPTLNINSKLNIVTSTIRRYQNLVHIYIRATVKAGETIAAYEKLFQNAPVPTENIPTALISGTVDAHVATVYTDGSLATNYAFSENTDIMINVMYFVPMNYDKH